MRNSVLFGLATEEASLPNTAPCARPLRPASGPRAVCLLLPEDKAELQAIIDRAWTKLRHEPVHIPGREHRQLHLTIFRRLNNPFVKGLLEAYWDAYDASELTRLAAYEYWLTVWEYHERIVTALCNNDYDHGLEILIEHFDLLPSVRVPQTWPRGRPAAHPPHNPGALKHLRWSPRQCATATPHHRHPKPYQEQRILL